jgi:diguanylate cyclase (GGDEF)-like protein
LVVGSDRLLLGDRVLQEIGRLLLRSFRQEDLVARWGGEEFIVGWHGITKQEASQRLEKVLVDIRALKFTADNGQVFGITFSAGVVQYPEDGDKFPLLYHRADHLLYQAKQMGRNRILSAHSKC